MLDLAIIILNYKTPDLTINCIESIRKKIWKVSYKILVVDNASGDGSVEKIKTSFPGIKIIESDKNVGYAKGNNLGIEKLYRSCRYCLILNSDTLVSEDALDILVEFTDSGFDIVSCRLVNPDGSFQPNAGELPYLLPTFFWLSGMDDILRLVTRVPSYQERDIGAYYDKKHVGWVSGSVMLVRSGIFDKIGFFDEKIFMYGEDVDFCWRAKKAGYKVAWTNRTEIVHIGGGSLEKARYSQWIGEFRGLLYLYQKYFGEAARLVLKFLIYFFVFLRTIAFVLVGKPQFSKTYAKILFNL